MAGSTEPPPRMSQRPCGCYSPARVAASMTMLTVWVGSMSTLAVLQAEPAERDQRVVTALRQRAGPAGRGLRVGWLQLVEGGSEDRLSPASRGCDPVRDRRCDRTRHRRCGRGLLACPGSVHRRRTTPTAGPPARSGRSKARGSHQPTLRRDHRTGRLRGRGEDAGGPRHRCSRCGTHRGPTTSPSTDTAPRSGRTAPALWRRTRRVERGGETMPPGSGHPRPATAAAAIPRRRRQHRESVDPFA